MDFVALLRSCAKTKDLHRGTRAHAHLLRWGLLEKSSYVADTLLNMYVKCGALRKAKGLLDGLPSRNVISWTALIAGCVQHGECEQALNFLDRMRTEGVSPNAVTFSCILKACGSLGAADKGEKIHEEIGRKGLLGHNIVLGNTLVDMYAKCGALDKAQGVLEKLPSRDVISWTTLIAGYAQQGQGEEALSCFEQMQGEGISPNSVTFLCLLKACGSVGASDKGEQIHDEIARQGLLGKSLELGSALVDMYSKCGMLMKARQVLEELSARDVVSWTALITGYIQRGQHEDALECFIRMQDVGVSPNEVTFACVLNACSSLGAGDKGKEIHDEIVRQGLFSTNIVLCSALVDMYAKCGDLAKAQEVLEEHPARDVVSWTALITGYVQQGHSNEAFDCFERMQGEGVSPNAITYACILKACSNSAAADRGERIHEEIANQGLLRKDIVLGNALVDMYVKCGALAKARKVLEDLPTQNVVSWTTLIAGYVQQGQSQEALDCFEQMQRQGLSPNAFTLSCILNTCSHSGLVEEGQMYFANMSTKYGIEPGVEHYTSMIDLFGRAGHIDKAVGMIRKMPSHDYCVAWRALLGACGKRQDVNVGRWAFEHATQVDKCDPAAYVLMANIYAAAGMQEEAESIKAMRLKNKAWKNQRQSWWVDMNANVHSYTIDCTENLYGDIGEDIALKLLPQAFSHDLHQVSQKIFDDTMKNVPSTHVDKLALACALFGVPQVMDNVGISRACNVGTSRACNVGFSSACNVATSRMLKLVELDVVIGDLNSYDSFHDERCLSGYH